jgi:hypothetical protein
MGGRIRNDCRAERDALEEAQSILLAAALDLDEVALRVEQAVRRTRIVEPVLRPALERLARIRSELKSARDALSEVWTEGQRKKWRG